MSVFIFILIVIICCVGLYKSKIVKDIHILWIVPLGVNFLWQLGNYFYLGYLDPFWIIAVSIGLVTSFFITAIMLLVFDYQDKRRNNS